MKKFILIITIIVSLHCSESKKSELSSFSIADTLCVSSHLKTEDDSSSQKTRREELRLLSDAGVKYLRRDFLWHEIESEKGRFDFSGYERIVNEAKEYGMEFIGLLAYGNIWASQKSRDCVNSGMSGCTNYPPDNPQDFANFVFETVSHFKDNVHRWEIWNEPNLGINFFKPFSDPEKYAEILMAAYEAVKSADPNALVSFGGVLMPDYEIEPSGIEFLQDVFNLMPDAGNYFDTFAFHPYMYPYPPSLPPEQESPPSQGSIITVIEGLRSELDKLKVNNKPLWVTEIGWPVINETTEELQAAYLIRSLLLSLARGVEIYCWYTTWDEDGSLFPEAENYFGLIRHFNPDKDTSPQPKKAYYALKNLFQTAGNYYLIKNQIITNDDNIYNIQLSDEANNKITVIWENNAIDNIVELETNGKSYRLINLYGEDISPEINDNRIIINPDIKPIYIIFRNEL